MLFRIAYLKKAPARVFRSIVGMGRKEFYELLPSFEAAYEKSLRKRQRDTERSRAPGGGAKPSLNVIEDRLIFILIYFRIYPTQILYGWLWQNSQPWACEWIHRLTPVLREALGYELQLPERAAATTEDLLKRCPELEFIIDGTERPIARPSTEPRQRDNYSGKKKRHTVKNTIVTNRKSKQVIYLGTTVPGKIHDKRAVDEEPIPFPPGSVVFQDLGYQGYAPSDVSVFLPKKKPRNKELTDLEKMGNRAISSVRIGVEHSIGGIKNSRIVHDVYRNRKHGFDDLVMEVACGIYNYRVDARSRIAA